MAESYNPPRLPEWLKRPWNHSEAVLQTRRLLGKKNLNTVCRSAGCPNLSLCFSRRTATFMILGNQCTRACRFCGVEQGRRPSMPDVQEPDHVAEAAFELGLRHVVITSVTRDDLPDGGASEFIRTVNAVKRKMPEASVEILIPDFNGNEEALNRVLSSKADVLGHNVETVPSLYPEIRPGADFQRSIRILSIAKKKHPNRMTKTGIMLGLGETESEVTEVFTILNDVSCDALTIGQYLMPAAGKAPVREYLHPLRFERYAVLARESGIGQVEAGPYVRSSFEAEKLFMKTRGARL